MPTKIKILPNAVKDQDFWNFSVNMDGLYLITITARCKNWLQNFRRRFNDDDLAVQIDDFQFFELKGKRREFNSVGAWNGNELKNNYKAVLFVLPLKAGEHKITFFVDGSADIKLVEVKTLDAKVVNFGLPAPADVKALDVVFKNVKVKDFAIINVKKENTQFAVQNIGSGTSSLRLQKVGEPNVTSIKINIIVGPEKTGWVKLYSDITTRTEINLYAEPKTTSTSLAVLTNGAELEIMNERVIGEKIENKSDVWHQVKYQTRVGFVLSSFVEIQGQERDKIIDLIKAKCAEPAMGVDFNIMLAIAGIESHFKPYAVSGRGASGIFQLTQDTAEQLNVLDRFDIYQNIDGAVRYFAGFVKKYTKRGNVLEKRLIAWQSGPGYVLNNSQVNYNILPYPNESREFVKRVLANMAKKDWKNILVLLLAVGIGNVTFIAGQLLPIKPANSSIPATSDCVDIKTVNSEEAKNSQQGNSFVFKSFYDDSPALISVKGLGKDVFTDKTEFFYCGDGVSERQYLHGSFNSAGWIYLDYAARRIFWIERSEGHYLPTTFFYFDTYGDRKFKQIKFIGKDGHERDDISAPFDILSANGESVLREWIDVVSRTTLRNSVKKYQFDYGKNIFREI